MMGDPPRTLRTAAERLRELTWGDALLRLVELASRLGVPDLLVEAPRTLDELASATGSDRSILERVVRAWQMLGVVGEPDGERITIGPMGRLITIGSAGADWLLQTREIYRPAFGQLPAVLETGRSGFELAFGTSVWEHRQADGALNDSFNRLMAFESKLVGKLMLDVYDFSAARTIVDVGGGTGELLRTILPHHPGLRGVIFDRGHVAGSAGPIERCEVVQGDFFAGVPPGGDVYILKQVLHDWDDGDATAILRQCRAAMAPTAQLLVVELVLGEAPEPQLVLSDLVMLAVHGAGRERTESEYRTLLAGAGFALRECRPTSARYQVLVADPI